VISVPGARALWLREDLPLAHPEVIARGREFAHIHPDGSLHVALPPERAREAVSKGWAEPHPLAQYLGNEGMVMLYTPLDMEELDVVFGLILDSYNFVTGRSLQPEEVISNVGEK
jgi:phospholipase/carboxylesterase